MRVLWGVLCFPFATASSHPLSVSPCADVTLLQLEEKGAIALKFPSPQSLTHCVAKRTHKFCYVKERLPLTARVSASTSASLCLPQQCTAADLQDLFDSLCYLPSCELLHPHSTLQALCAAVQPLHCNPRDRTQPRDGSSVVLHCVHPSEYDSEIIMEETRRLLPDDPQHNVALSGNDMDALVSCGSNTFRHWESLLLSGGLQDLGDYETCVENPENNYCVTKFYAMLTTGRCLPASCREQNLADLFTFICDHIGTEEAAMKSCLDFIDVIPLDLCVSVQLLGCSRAIQMSIVNSATGALTLEDLFGAHNSTAPNLKGLLPGQAPPTLSPSSLLSLTAGAVKGALQAVHDARPDIMDTAGLNYMEAHASPLSMFPRLADLSQDALDEGMLGAVAAKSFKVVCDLSGPSKREAGFAIAIALVSLFFVVFPILGLFGTPIHKEGEPEVSRSNSLSRFLGAFSVRNNLMKMDKSRQTLARGPFNHLCGMRVISLMWIVVGHTFSFVLLGGVLSNLSEVQHFFQRYTFQLVISAQLSVDSFFFFSGFVLSVFGTNRIQRTIAKITSSNRATSFKCLQINSLFLLVILKRFVRLVPTMLFVLGLSFWGVPYLGSGPNWPALETFLRDGVRGGCRRYWWTNALMINNIVPGADQMECFGQGWYLANDFQFFIVGTILIMLGSIGIVLFRALAAVLLIASVALTAYIAWRYNLTSAMAGFSGLPSDPSQSSLMSATAELFARYYNKPWCRIGPYLVGLIFGSLYREGDFARWLTKEEGRRKGPLSLRNEIDGVLVSLGHLIAGSLMFALVYVLPFQLNAEDAVPWNRTLDITYFAASRSLWAVCLGWFTVVMAFCPVHPHEEKSVDEDTVLIDDSATRLMKRLLSGSTFCLLTLFTYAGYLVHPIIQQVYYALSPTAAYMSELNGWFDTIFHGVISMSVAAVLYVMVETVMANLFAFVGL